jgi:hypothetical protein
MNKYIITTELDGNVSTHEVDAIDSEKAREEFSKNLVPEGTVIKDVRLAKDDQPA